MYQTELVDSERLQASPRAVSRWQKAQQLLLAGLSGQALDIYRELIPHYPGVAQLWFERGMAAAGDLEYDEAHAAFQKTVELAPADVALLVLVGQQYHRLRQLDHARECFERAVAADPASVHARLSLAAWFERERRLDEAWDCVETCLRQHPQNAHALYYRAFLLHRRGDQPAAERALRELIQRNQWPDEHTHCSALHLLGVVLDELGQYAEAFRLLCDSKARLRPLVNAAALEKQYDQLDRQRRQLFAALTPELISKWRNEPSATPPHPQLIFLGGHPRSGTTLVEQVLGANPRVLAFDEPEAFVQEVERGASPGGQGLTLAALNNLIPERRAVLRQRYFKSLLRENTSSPNADVLLDKNPSPTVSLPLWLRVFPELKVIIPLRDPRDVIISCFFQNLPVTAGNVNFLNLDRTVRQYMDQMDAWLGMRELGGFDWVETKYEDVVANLQAEGRRLTHFIDLDWDPGQEHYYEQARRKFVFAPTYHDVTKPVYTHAIRRWEHYAAVLAPFQDRLAPYCQKLGYS